MEQQKIVDSLNGEFEAFFQYCKANSISKKDMSVICSSLNYQLQLKLWKRVGIFAIVCSLILWLAFNVNFLNWTLSAFGRIFLIKLLPIWDWTYLYDENCLVSYKTELSLQDGPYGSDSLDDVDKTNCALCENLDRVDRISDATFHYIEDQYLEKGHPVIVENSHKPYKFHEFVEKITALDDYIETDPCDIESNFLLKRFANLDDLLRKAGSPSANDNWFFHLRNCHFEAVKKSRKFIPKPEYYPMHLAPFYSSWLLMSSPIAISDKELHVEGLVVVMQISGRLGILLSAKTPCLEQCGQHQIVLDEGDALVFLSDLWKFSYILDNDDYSATVITETKWE